MSKLAVKKKKGKPSPNIPQMSLNQFEQSYQTVEKMANFQPDVTEAELNDETESVTSNQSGGSKEAPKKKMAPSKLDIQSNNRRKFLSQSSPLEEMSTDLKVKKAEPVLVPQKKLDVAQIQESYFPIKKCMEVKNNLITENHRVVSFYGVTQLTDLGMFTMMVHNKDGNIVLSGDGLCKTKCADVLELDLSGCFHVSDFSMFSVKELFPNLESIDLAGCHKITETGLHILLEGCPKLKKVNIRGTSVTILPYKAASVQINVDGYPCISPDKDILAQQGTQIMRAPAYPKPTDKDLVKVCIINGPDCSQSLLEYLNKEMDLSTTPLNTLTQFKLSDRFSVNFVECHESISDLFITKRAVYIFTVSGSADVKKTAARIFALICQIINKVQKATYVLAGLNNSEKSSLDQIKNEITAMAKTKAASLRKSMEMDLAEIFKGDVKKSPEKFTSIQEQQMAMTKMVLSRCLDILSLESMDIDTTKQFAGPHTLKPLISACEKLCTLCPEYQELADPIFKLANQNTVDKMLGTGIVSVQSNKASSQKILELMEIMGRTMVLSLIEEENLVCLINWLATVVNTAFTPPPTSVLKTRVNGIPDSTPMWTREDLKSALEKLLSSDQASNGVSLFFKLGLSMYPSVVIAYKDLPSEPEVPLEQFFPEIPSINQRTEVFYTVGYHAVFSTLVPSFVMRQIQALSSLIRKWSLIWKRGVIIQEGFVETLIEYQQEKGDSSSIGIYSHTVKQHQGNKVTKTIEETVWNSLLQFKAVVDYVLTENNIPHEMTLVMGKEPSRGVGLIGVVSGHPFRQEDSGLQACTQCGIQPKANALSWILKSSTCLDVPPQDAIVLTGNAQMVGNLVKFAGQGSCIIKTSYPVNEQHKFSVHLLNGPVEKLQLGLGFGYQANTKSLFGSIYIDFKTKQLVKEKNMMQTRDIEETYPLPSVPTLGDTVTFLLREKPANLLVGEVCVYRNTELLGTFEFSSHLYMPYLRTDETSVAEKIDVVVHPLFIPSVPTAAGFESIQAGMKLEAVDRKNPSLVCVATVEKINPDGTFCIHFDGWGPEYDYVTEPTSKDLHPLGYMYANMNKYGQLRQELQRPRGWAQAHGDEGFTWIQHLKETNSLPVPFYFFTPEQVEDTTPDLWKEAIFHVAQNSTSCIINQNRARVFEFNTLNKSRRQDKMFEFFTSHSKFFCLLPIGMNLTKLQYPSIQSVMDFSKQNVHILCPGTKMELLHFLDDAGVPLTKYDSLTETHNAAFIQKCMAGLCAQEETLPKKCSKLIPGIENMEDQEQCESWLMRLLFMYMCVMELHASDIGQNATVNMTREALEIFNSTLKNEKVSSQFQEGDRYVRCKGHAGSSMANNGLREIPLDEFSQVAMFMTRLDFQNNQIGELPEEFFTMFKGLEYLNISKNGISELPPGIGKLPDLSELDISSNRFTSLPQELEKLKDSLTSLNISNNNLNDLPACIFKLQKLVELNAENIGKIGDISPLRNLMELKDLNLGLNHIEKIPDELGDLPLEYLNLSGVPWIPQATYQSYMAFMKQLDMNNVTRAIDADEQKKMFKNADVDESSTLTPNEVLTLSHEVLFSKYPRFGNGQLKFEKTGGIPPVLFNLTKLKKLVLRYHGIQQVPDEIKVFENLNEIDLSYNPKMVTISAELGGLPLKQIHLTNCVALNTPPKEIVARGFLAIMGYLKRLRLGAVPCKRTKLMMVGLGGAGKTSLVQSLMNQRYRAYMDYDEPITDGIDITKWVIPIAGEDDVLTFSVWDFAGQTVYYNTHQFFLSNRAVYLLLWNVRQGYEHAGLDFWLCSIACHAPKAPIMVVGTHIDKVEKFRLPEESLRARFPQIVGFHYVSSFTGMGVEELRNTIISNTLQQKYMGEKIPEAWLTLEKRLISYREEKNVDILPFRIVEGISASCGIFDRGELVQAIQFLHDLGAVQFFDTDFLREMVVIYPQWIVDVMACLVTVHQGAVNDGKLLSKDVSKVWEKYPADLHPWLLRLTEEFDLTCALPDEEASIVPCLLPDSEPKYDWPHADPEKNIRESMTLYKFQYLPAGLFNRAQVRLHQYSKGALLWKTGSFMKKNDHIALMLQTDDQEVIVRAQGFRPENFLFIVHEMIETLIAESYSGVHYDFFMPCMDCQSRNVKDPSMISYQKVKRALELNVPFLQCEKFFHMLSLHELKDAMPSDKMDEMDSHLRSSVRELKDLTQEKTVSVLFVYSLKDVPELKDVEKLVHPGEIMEDLRSRDEFKVSYTDKPETSDMEALTLSIKSSDVVIFGLSDNFAENAECKKLLLYSKEVLQRPILLLLLGATKNWQKGELNMPLGDEVFVDMTNKGRYPNKIKELYEAIKKKAVAKKKVKDGAPACFISYCWTNSHDAIAKGSRSKDGALGWSGGDPRVVKKFLSDKGVSCWIDVEQVGGVGLYTSIADGLREAKVMVAFVSDEYAESKNCVMEFRQSLITLRIPTIIVVVGTGYEWERNEVGLMAVGQKCPKVNLQFDNEAGYLQLLKLVQEKIQEGSKGKDDMKDVEKQRNIAFQEVMELTQRKFLRHLTNSIISSDLEPYPCLLVVDFISDKEKQEWENAVKEKEMAKKNKESSDSENKPGTSGAEMGQDQPGVTLKSKYCFRLICEHTEGWHVMPKFIPFPAMDLEEEQQLIESCAPYLARIYTIIKYSNLQLECLTTPEGEIFQQRIEEIGVKSGTNFKNEYLELRTIVMQEDKIRGMAGLYRGTVNGKLVWLCDTHKKAARSKTEEKYGGKFETENAIPLGDLPESFATIEGETRPEPTPVESNKPKKLFRRNISEGKPNNLKRQTSQACNVM